MVRALILVSVIGCAASSPNPAAPSPTPVPAIDAGAGPTSAMPAPETAAPTTELATAPTSAASGTHRLRVTLRGAGSVVGRVVSSPAGLDCAVTSSMAGPNEKQCEAALPTGRVTLTFTPGGAASTAQFSVVRGGQRSMCEGKTGATTCTVQLDGELQIDVFPISAPPPPP